MFWQVLESRPQPPKIHHPWRGMGSHQHPVAELLEQFTEHKENLISFISHKYQIHFVQYDRVMFFLRPFDPNIILYNKKTDTKVSVKIGEYFPNPKELGKHEL